MLPKAPSFLSPGLKSDTGAILSLDIQEHPFGAASQFLHPAIPRFKAELMLDGGQDVFA